MAVFNARAIKSLSFDLGVDNTTVLTSPEAMQGTLSDALNVDLVDDNLAIKRNGYESLTTWGSRIIRGGFEYNNVSGSKEILLYGQDATPTGVSGVLGSADSNFNITSLETGLKDNIKPQFIQLRSLVFLLGIGQNLVYDGTSVRQIGIDAPTTKPTLIRLRAGDLNTSGSYQFVYTYYNSTTGAESSPSAPSDTITTGTSSAESGITISLVAGDSSLADKIRVYRTVSGGSTFFYDGGTTITDTTYQSVVSDAGLGDEVELDNSRPDGIIKFGAKADNRAFIVTDSNPNRVYHSKIGIRGPMPESFQVLDFIDCDINDGDEIVGLLEINSTILVFKKRSIGKLLNIQANVGGLERGGSTKYIYKKFADNVTCINHHCITNVKNYAVWLGTDKNIYISDGASVTTISDRVYNTLKRINYSQAHKFSVHNKSETSQVIFSVCIGTKTEPDFQIVGHYNKLPRIAFTFYSAGTNTTTHPGVIAACMFGVTENNTKRTYFGNSSGNGKLYRLDSGTSDDTKGIYFYLKTPWENRPDASMRKKFHSYHLFAAGSGNTYNITTAFELDLQESTQKTMNTSLVAAGGPTWGNVNWNNFNWGSVKFKPITFRPKLKGYFGRLVISNTNADEPVAIKGITSQLQVTDRRHL